MASLGEAVVEVGADTSGFRGDVERGVNAATKSATRSMENVGKKMSSAGRTMSLAVTAPIVAAGVKAVDTAGKFETSMNILQAATGMGEAGMKALQDQAITLGADTVFSANEAADAMVELGKAGMNQAEIMAAVPEVLSLAATEGLALADASGIVTSAMAPFGLKADEVGQAVNALAGASNASKASVATLSQALKLVGGAASGTGLSVQETTGALAALAQNGLEGGIAGTSLAGVLRRLQPATTKAADAMEQLGLDFVKGNGEFESIDNVAGQLQKTFKGMPAAARQAKLSAIFGNDASVMQAVNALINTGAQGMRDFTKASSDQSAASNLAEARMKGVQGAIEKMKGSLETAALVLGQALIPVISTAAGFIADLADRFTNLSPTAQKFALVGLAIAAAIGPVLVIVGTLISSIGAIAGVFAGVTAAVAAPIAVFALLAVGIGMLLAKSEAARAVVTGAFNEIKNAIMSAVGPIMAQIQGSLIPAFQTLWPVIEKVGVIVLKVFAGAVVGAVKGAIQVISGIVSVVTGVVQVISGVLSGDWSRAWEGVKNIVSGVLDAVVGIIKVWLNVGVLSLFRRGFSLLTGLVRGGWNALKGLFSSGMSAVGNLLKKIGNILLAPHRAAFNALRGLVTGAWNALKAVTSAAMNGIRAVVSAVWGAIRGAVGNALSAIRGVVSNGWSAVRSATSNAWNAISGAVSSGVGKAVNFVKDLPSKAAAIIRGGAGAMMDAGRALIAGLVSGVSEKIGDAVQVVRDGLSKIAGLLPGSPIKWGPLLSWNNGGAGVRLMDLLAKGIIKGIPDVVAAVDSAATVIANGMEDIDVGPATKAMVAAYENVTEAITGATEKRLEQQQALRDREYEAAKRAADKEYDTERKRLEKKYDGKKEQKKLDRLLAGLKDRHDRHAKDLEKAYNKDSRALKAKERTDRNALLALANQQRNAIIAMAGQWDALDLQLEGVKASYDNALSELEDKVGEMASLSQKVRDSLIQSVFKNEGDVPPSFEAMITSLQDQEAAAARYGDVLAQLAGMGLNPTSFQQIADAGVDGLAAAEALLASGSAGVAQVNALQASINTYAQTAGDTVAHYLLGAGVALAQSAVDSFAAQQSTLESQMATLGQAMAEAFADSLSGIDLPGAGGGGGGGGGGGNGKHQWVRTSKTNPKCSICGKPRSAPVHTNESNADGRLSSAGGWMEVGERGRELVRLPGGSRVYDAQQSARMSGGGDTFNINLTMPTDDPEAAAVAVMDRIARRGR